MKRIKKEKGAVVVEATLVIPMFIFLVITLMWIANMCTAQAKMQIAVNSAAKELSSYSYLYGLTGLNAKRAEWSAKGAGSEKTSSEAISGVKKIYNGLSETFTSSGNLASGEAGIGETADSLKDSYDSVSSGIGQGKQAYESIKKDPKGYLIGLAYSVGSDTADKALGTVAGGIGRYFCEKHLVASNLSANAYMKKLGIVNGFSGVKFDESRFCDRGGEDIYIVAEYQLAPIRFFNIDIKYNIVQAGETKAWFGKSSNDKE